MQGPKLIILNLDTYDSADTGAIFAGWEIFFPLMHSDLCLKEPKVSDNENENLFIQANVMASFFSFLYIFI